MGSTEELLEMFPSSISEISLIGRPPFTKVHLATKQVLDISRRQPPGLKVSRVGGEDFPSSTSGLYRKNINKRFI